MMRSVRFNVSALLWTFYTIMIHILNNLYGKLSIICVLGDLGDIDWQSSSIKPCCQHAPICEQLIEMANDHGLSQIVDKPTRTTSTTSNILDIFLTNCPDMVNRCEIIPGISNHDIPLLDISTRIILNSRSPHKIYQYHKATLKD